MLSISFFFALELSGIFAEPENYTQLVIAWERYVESGAEKKYLFSEFVALSNEAIRILGINYKNLYDLSSIFFENEIFHKK